MLARTTRTSKTLTWPMATLKLEERDEGRFSVPRSYCVRSALINEGSCSGAEHKRPQLSWAPGSQTRPPTHYLRSILSELRPRRTCVGGQVSGYMTLAIVRITS
jgi:hypothetical protein